MTRKRPSTTGPLWARFRFSVVGSLLSSPPARGSLHREFAHLPRRPGRIPCPARFPCCGQHHRVLVLHGAPPA